MKVVIDTNILLVSISGKSPYHWIFQSLLNKEFDLCITTEILLEYEEIIGKRMGKEVAEDITEVLLNLSNVIHLNTYYRWNLIKADPDDNKFTDCAIAANANYLVSNDKHFNDLKSIDFPHVELINIIEFKKILGKSF